MAKSERILKKYQKTVNPAAVAINVDSNGFYDIVDANCNILTSGDILKYSSLNKIGTFKK